MIFRTTAALALAAATLAPAAFAQEEVDVAAEMELAAQGDAAAGEKVFNKCKACHQVGPDAANRVGPTLTGVVGRKIGSVEDFKYSDAFHEKEEEGFYWTVEHMTEYLASPKDYIPGNKMTFAGLRKEEDIANVIAYLASFQ